MTARILIIDDTDANVRLLEAKMTTEYYEVLTATDGHSGIALAKSQLPDIILLDVMMPGLSGYEICRHLKEDPDTRHIPVILVTALDGRDDLLTGLDAGADDFMTKPIDDVMLMARLKGLVRLKLAIDGLRLLEASGRRMGVIAGTSARLGGFGGHVAGLAVGSGSLLGRFTRRGFNMTSPTAIGLGMFALMLLMMAVRVPIAAAMFIPGTSSGRTGAACAPTAAAAVGWTA
jgi:CheY-like chemotaxis protein